MLTPVDKRLRRLATGIIPLFTPTNTGVVALYNNSTGPFILAVWDFVINPSSGAGTIGYNTQVGTLTTLVGPGTSVFTDEATPPGLCYSDDLASPAAVIANFNGTDAFSGNPDGVPLALLKPNWSIVMQAGASATPIGGTFIYEWFNPAKLVEWELP